MVVQKSLRPRVERMSLHANPEAAERRSGLRVKARQVDLGAAPEVKGRRDRRNGEFWLEFL
jgi:hypothetical protein